MLKIKAYHTLAQERAGPAKQQKTDKGEEIRTVVKNQTFVVDLCVAPGCSLDLSRSCISAELLYDCDGLKPVAYVRQRPLEYFTASSTPQECTLELRARVLTSQHEDSLFRIRFTAMDTCAMLSADAVSDPVRAISKAETRSKASMRKLKEQKAQEPVEVDLSDDEKTPKRGVKRSAEEKLKEQVTEQEQNIADLEETLSELRARLQKRQPKKPRAVEQETQTACLDPEERLEAALIDLVSAFSAIEPEERPAKIRRITEHFSDADIDMARATADALFSAVFPTDVDTLTSITSADREMLDSTPHHETGGEVERLLLGLPNCDDSLQQFPSW